LPTTGRLVSGAAADPEKRCDLVNCDCSALGDRGDVQGLRGTGRDEVFLFVGSEVGGVVGDVHHAIAIKRESASSALAHRTNTEAGISDDALRRHAPSI
jgi:hypothetical protein